MVIFDSDRVDLFSALLKWTVKIAPKSCHIFRLNTLKVTMKAPAVDLLRLNTLRGTKTAFFTPKGYDEHPRHFYIGVPPPPPSLPGLVVQYSLSLVFCKLSLFTLNHKNTHAIIMITNFNFDYQVTNQTSIFNYA